ncbi:EpsG family protein [Marinomonas agarivorans]|nr:EpsG family protein [Marinomonas agarivorans]
MMIYFTLVLFIMMFVSANIMYYYSSNKRIIFVFVFVFTVLVFFTRSYMQPDFYNYKLIYDSIYVRGELLNYIISIEIGFLGLLSVFSSLGLDYFQVSNVIFFLICTLFGIAAHQHHDIKKGEAYLLLALFFSSYYFYFLSLNVVRQGLAVAIFSIGLSRLLSNRNYSALFFLIAVLFHYSAILLFLIVFFSKYVSKKISIIACFVVIFLSCLFGFFDVLANFPFPDFIAIRIQKLKYYNESTLGSYIKLLFYFFTCLLYFSLLVVGKKISRDVFFLSSGFLVFSLLFMNYGEFLDRLMMYSIAFSAFIFVDIYRVISPRSVGNIVLFFYCLLSYVFVFLSSPLNGFFV